MSTKKRKNNTPWWECESCNAIIFSKDSIAHKERACPPNTLTWTQSFIFKDSLFTSLETFQREDKTFQYICMNDRDDFILMPLHVLQLCKIPIGDPVVIKSNNPEHIAFVKLAWPSHDKPNFTAALTNEALILNSLSLKDSIIVSKLKEDLDVAEIITLSSENDKSSLDVELILKQLQIKNCNKIFCIGNKILLKYYGKKLVFKILEITSINGGSSKNCFCLTDSLTKFVLNDSVPKKSKKIYSLSKLGGLSETVEEIKDFISFIFDNTKIVSGLHLARGILIHGPMGTGKTSLIESIAEHFTSNIIRVDTHKIISKIIGETEKELQTCFDQARQSLPSIILIDDIDILCTGLKSSSEYERRIVAALTYFIDDLNAQNMQTVILATTSKIHLIDKMLRASNRFSKEVEIFVPNSLQRFEILSILLLDVKHNLSYSEIKSIVDSAHGYVGADLVSLTSKAMLKNYQTSEGNNSVSVLDFEWALSKVKPSAMKEIMIEIPNVKWEDIGGQEDLKLKLRQCVEWPLKYKKSFDRLGITPPKGLLMFGPPGCSKTMIAKALATESKLNFISVKGPELFSKWVGESERAVQKVFRRARQAAPSIVFIDELDAIAGERNMSSGSASVQERVLAQMLIELDGVEPLKNVTVVAATNRLDRIDSALLRPGRLDRIIYVPLPDSKTRQQIFNIQLKKTCIDSDVVVKELVEKTEGYSGAEVVAVCREASLKALEENFEADKVKRKHFLEALEIVLPRTPKYLLEMYENHLKNKTFK